MRVQRVSYDSVEQLVRSIPEHRELVKPALNAVYLGIVQDGRLVCCGGLTATGFIKSLATAEHCRRRGFAAMVVKALIDSATCRTIKTIATRHSRQLFVAAGFQVVASFPNGNVRMSYRKG